MHVEVEFKSQETASMWELYYHVFTEDICDVAAGCFSYEPFPRQNTTSCFERTPRPVI